MSAAWEYAIHSAEVAAKGGPELYVNAIKAAGAAEAKKQMKKIVYLTGAGGILIGAGIVYASISLKQFNNEKVEQILKEGKEAEEKFIKNFYLFDFESLDRMIKIIEKANNQ